MTEQTTTEATEEIRMALAELYAAWADNDPDAFTALYRDDATVVMPGVLHLNRTQIRASMAAAFEGPLRGLRGVDEPLTIRIIGADVAVVVSRAGILMAGESELPAQREVHATWVLSRESSRWLIVAYANAAA